MLLQYMRNIYSMVYVYLSRTARDENRKMPPELLVLKFTSKSCLYKMCMGWMQSKQKAILFQKKDSIMLNCVKSIYVNDAKSVTAVEIVFLFSIMISLWNHPAYCYKKKRGMEQESQIILFYFSLLTTNKLLRRIYWS